VKETGYQSTGLQNDLEKSQRSNDAYGKQQVVIFKEQQVGGLARVNKSVYDS